VSDIIKYSLEWRMGGKGLYASDSGGWVRFADHESALAALSAERDNYRESLANLTVVAKELSDDIESLRAENAALRERVERAEAALRPFAILKSLANLDRWDEDSPVDLITPDKNHCRGSHRLYMRDIFAARAYFAAPITLATHEATPPREHAPAPLLWQRLLRP
jgi:hypothetical protein